MLVLGALLILGAPTWRPQYELKTIYADEDLATTTSQVDHAAVKAKSDGLPITPSPSRSHFRNGQQLKLGDRARD